MAKASSGPWVEFPRSEYTRRYRRASALMREHGLDALLVTSEPNHRYLTGHRTQFWASKSRPMYTVLPEGRPPVCLVTELEGNGLAATSYVRDIRTFVGFADESVPALAGLLAELGLAGGRVGVDYGDEMRLGLPLPAYRKLERSAERITFVDGAPVLWALRLVKSAAEIAYIRKACRVTATGIRHGWKALRAGMTARRLHRLMRLAMVEAGAERLDWFALIAGEENVDRYTLEPTDRRFRRGDIVWADIGVTVNGYWSDFNRIACVGPPTPSMGDDYRRILEVNDLCIGAVRPGIPVHELVRVRDAAFREIGYEHASVHPGRMGHGSGLDMTEPPSIAETDETVLEPGMVLHIEPKIVRRSGIFQLEELVAVTRTGAEMITRPAPRTLPVAG